MSSGETKRKDNTIEMELRKHLNRKELRLLYKIPREDCHGNRAIYSREFGGNPLKRLLCCALCHEWSIPIEMERKVGQTIFKLEVCKCIHCGREEVLVLMRWRHTA